MDERMPRVPALKWEHMMESPPCYAHVIPPVGQGSTSKILLGAQKGQETFLLQYSGGKELPCQADGPVQKLCSPCESLKQCQLPHKQYMADKRLAVPATGLAAVQNNGFLCVFQLTEAGDLFYQTLRHVNQDGSNLQPSDPEEPTPRLNPVHQPPLSEEGASNTNCSRPRRPANPETASKELMLRWKTWLDTLLTASKKQHLSHKQIKTSEVVTFNRRKIDKLDQDKFQSLRNNLTDILKNKKMLVQGATYLPSLEVTPLPDVVRPDDWPDDLSQRLSASWEGGWKYWWDDKLGLNKEDRIEALRRKRLRQKRERARNRVALSGSFTSSIGYQDNLSDFSFGVSQESDSDAETVISSQSTKKKVMPEQDALPDSTVLNTEHQNTTESPKVTEPIKSLLKSPRKETISSEQNQTLDTTSRSQQNQPEQKTETDSISSRLQRRRQQQDYLNSLFSSQEASQDYGQDEESGEILTMSQLSTTSVMQRASSQIRTSQPQKKRSRMGF